MGLVPTLGSGHRWSFQQEAFKQMTQGLPSVRSKYPAVTASSALPGQREASWVADSQSCAGAPLENGEPRDAVGLALLKV